MLAELFADNGIVDSRYDMLCDDVEYRTGLVQQLLGDYPNSGEFSGDGRWEHLSNNWDDQAPSAEMRFRDDINRNDDAMRAWTGLISDETPLDDFLIEYRQTLERYRKESLFR